MQKGEQTKPKANKKKEIVNIRVEMYEIENEKTMGSIKTKIYSFKNINKINRYLARKKEKKSN